jgi:c(7)-type cytochrome triheme protein
LSSIRSTLSERLGPLVYLSTNWISRIGILLVTAAGVLWLFTLARSFTGRENPYLGALTVFLLPALFFLGLALIPLGIRLHSRKTGQPPAAPPFQWSNPHFRSLVGFIGVATVLNVILGALFTHKVVEHMDSVEFCGASCHIMKPEFTAYKIATHSQVACVDCHIGEGAESYVKAKLNGAKQLLQVITGTTPAVVETPVHNMAQGKLTCVNCHADRDFGKKRWEEIHFASNEQNSATRTQLELLIGGGSNKAGAHGAHVAKGTRIEYGATPDRKTVDWVRYRAADGRETLYQRSNLKSVAEARTMDCTDCHNRAAHSFEDPVKALDRSLASGRIDHTLPKIKEQGLAVLKQKGGNHTEVLRAFYQSQYPELAAARTANITKASAELVSIRDRNLFPEWGVDWGTHPNYKSHLGCFRCHNDELVSQDSQKRPIGRNCTTCHRIEKLDEPVAEPVSTLQSSASSSLPGKIDFNSAAGSVPFDHAQHLTRAKGECSACHDKYFPMARTDIRYKGDLHRPAEAARTSCAGCHVAGGTAFAAAGSCARCHTNLSEPMRQSAATTSTASASPGLPGGLQFSSSLGPANFDHAEHIKLAKGDCTSCHNRLFPMSKADLQYRNGLHRPAEAARSSCAGCHVAGGTAFASANNCQRCHSGLGTPRPTPSTGLSGLPDSRPIETRLGPAKFDHARHVTLNKNDCQSCHNRIFPLARGLLNYADNLHRNIRAEQDFVRRLPSGIRTRVRHQR